MITTAPARRTLLLAALLAAAAPGADAGADPAKSLVGKYACTFTQGDTTYRKSRCVISLRDGELWLEKLDGSQRIKGELTPTDAGFQFSGTYYCPMGDCTVEVKGEFRRGEKDRLVGTLDDPQKTVVTLTRAK